MPWLVKCTPYDPALPGERTLYFSDVGFMSAPGDSPADTYWVRRLEAAFTAAASLFGTSPAGGAQIGGRSEVTIGDITLTNDDGALDGLAEYDWGGRGVTVLWTSLERPSFADFATIFTGATERVVPGDLLGIELRDRQVLLDAPYQPATFAGTGGAEGPSTLTGRRKPRLLGRGIHIAPVPIDSAGLVFCFGSGPSGGVLAAYDGGSPLTFSANYADYTALIGATVPPGTYATCHALSLIRLGDQLGSVLTVDADGVEIGGEVLETFADIAQFVIDADTEMSSDDFESGTVAAMNSAAPQYHGHWFDGSRDLTVRQVLDEIAQSILAYYLVTPAGKIRLGMFDAPALTPDHEFGERDIFEIEPRPAARRLKKQTIRYARKWRPLQPAEVLGIVSDGDRDELGREWKQAEYPDAGVEAEALLATEETLDTTLYEDAEAADEAERRVALFGPMRSAFRVVVPLRSDIAVGQTAMLTHPRYGLAGGKSFVILAAEPDAVHETIELEVWG